MFLELSNFSSCSGVFSAADNSIVFFLKIYLKLSLKLWTVMGTLVYYAGALLFMLHGTLLNLPLLGASM